MAMNVTVKWSELGITGKQKVRDLWRQKDLGEFADAFSSKIPRHGALFVKIAKVQPRVS
jgi:alpha-galactosidase